MSLNIMLGALRQGRTGSEILQILDCITPNAIEQQDYNQHMNNQTNTEEISF